MKATTWYYRTNMILASLMIVSLLLTSCAALPDVMQAAPVVVAEAASSGAAVGALETLRGMSSVLVEGSGAFIMQSGDNFLLAWPSGSAWEFVFLNASGAPMNGIKLNVFSFSDLVKQLEALGWQYVAPSALPAALTNVLMFGTNALPTIFVLPAILLDEVIPAPPPLDDSLT